MRRITEKTMKVSFTKRIVAIVMMVSYIFVLCPLSLFAESVTNDTEAKRSVSVKEEKSEVLISAEEGGIVTLGDASIEIPEGALKKDTKISITRLLKVEDTGESLYNAIPHSGGYRFLPAGTKFEKEVTITLPYSSELNAKPQSLDELYTYFYDTQKKCWIKLERLEVDKKNHKVRSLSTHFTDMINATLTMPESASPVDVNLNSIKNLEAAKPDSHLIKFNPPKASNMGDASFSFELAVPAGRKGMQPQISVSYSSGGGNGIMGKGFDVSYGSSITTDTRFGLPNYDTHDTYMLDGILLAEESRQGTKITYKPQKESAFSHIIRYGAGTNNDHWEITDKNGTKRIYGIEASACTGSGSKIFVWNITMTQDVHGNNVVYEYEKSDGYVYPKNIYYTGFDGKKGNYKVQFHYDSDGLEKRQDVHIDARSRGIISCKKLLTSITTHYKDEEYIRKYNFNYTEGLAKEKMLSSLFVSNNANESYEYTFDYSLPEKNNDGNIIYFAEAKEWNNGQPLQVGNSTNIGANFNGAAGLGYGTRVIDVRATAGGSGSVSSGESYTEDSMLDINGDGRPDAISQKGETVYVALNNGAGFDEKQAINIKSGTLSEDLDHEKNSSSSVGWNIYGGAGSSSGSLSLGVGYSEVKQKSSSKSLCSFIDMDRDGLPDIVETGKSTYLKNLGNLEFEQRNIYSSIAVTEVTQKVKPDLAEEYRKTYFVQTPFRMWKAPYEGIITITESAYGVSENFDKGKQVIAKTYKNDEESDDTTLRINITAPNITKTSRNTMDVVKASDYYFISDNGKEPEKTDIDWDINIEYSDIKTFKKGLKHPLLNLKKYEELKPVQKTYSNNGNKAKEDYKNFVVSEYLDNQTVLLKLFSITVQEVHSNNNNSYEYLLNAQYDSDWTKKTNIEEQKAIISTLIENKCLIPSVFTESQFTEYYESVKTNASKSSDIIKYYSDFAMQFEHDVTDNLYLFRDFTKEYTISDFLETYPIPKGVQTAALLNYKQNGITASFSVDDIFYGCHSEKEFNGERDIRNEGTVTNKVLNVGTYNSSDLFIDLVDNKLKFRGDKENFVPLEISSDVINTTVTENSVSIQYGINKDKYGNYESIITVTLDGLSYRALNLSNEEFQKIVDDIDVAYSDVHDNHWKLEDTEDETKRIKTSDIDTLFNGMELVASQKEEFISALYEKKDVYTKIEINNPDGSSINNEEPKYKEVLVYSYYILKENADYTKAQKILDEYKKEIVYKEKYPFYTISNGNYILKNEWKVFKEKETARSEWISEIEAEILNAEPELKQDNPAEFLSKVETVFEKRYAEYLNLDGLLLAECRKFDFGKFSSMRVSQEFNIEHLYNISNNSYSLLVAENGFNLDEVTYTLPKTNWNSGRDYSTANINCEKVVYSYDKTVTQDGVTDTAVEEIKIQNDEFLYGGKGNWFYGIWKGSLSDIPFSKETLQEYKKSIEGINSTADFDSKKASVPTEISDKQKEQKKTDDIHFYLPQKKDECEFSRNNNDFRNAAIPYTVDYSDSLLGTVATYSEVRKTAEGRKTVTDYYMPFIFGNIIHVDRAGGISYYKIEGLRDDSNNATTQLSGSSLFLMPTIRKSYTEAIDKTPTAKVGIGPVSADFSKTSNSNSAKDSYSMAISLPGGSGSVGENNSTSTSNQILQDVNIDGIPDIVQIDNGVLKIIEGTKLNENGEISFNKEQTISGISYLSKNETSSKVYGGSVSAQGSVKQEPKITSYGNIKYVVVEPQATSSASGGLTYSKSSSLQTHGIRDINCDGLPDYYNGNFYAINNGSLFSPNYTNFSIGNMSESQSQSIGMNFSVGIGGVTGSSDLYAAKTLKSGANGTIGITYNSTTSNTEKMMMDINGDGLQDILEMSAGNSVISVRYNTGCGFTSRQGIELPGWKNFVKDNYEKFLTQADSNGFDLGLIKDIPVIGAAASKGLTSVSINPFGFNAENFSNSLDWNTSVTLGMSGTVGANVNIGIDIIILCVYCGTINITVSGGAGTNASTSINGASVKMMDLDGDGLADHVLRIPGFGTYWKRNISGRYGQLTGINLPQGGNIQLEYAEQYGTTKNPNFKYVLSKVTMNDGCNETVPEIKHGNHSVTTVYEYEDGYYDRQKKDFFGFRIVKTTNADGTYQVDEYNTEEYYAKGSLKKSCSYGNDGIILSKSETTLRESPYAQPQYEYSWTYEKTSENSEFIHTTTEYKYDEFGNCIEIKQNFGDGEILLGKVIYDNTNTTDYIVGLPVDIRVYDSNGNLLRHRSGDYDDLGQLKELRQYFNAYNYSVHTLKYDSYGNIKSVTDSRGATVAYSYDGTENMFVTDIAQSGTDTDTYKGSIKYDIPTQTKRYEEDCSGNTINYDYDDWQRIVEIRTDYDGKEKSKTPAVSYEYNTPNNDSFGHHELWYAITNNKVTFDADDDSIIQTVLQIDGLGRAVRTAKTGFVNGVEGWNASGAVEYDEKGRIVKEGMTEFIQGDIQTLLESVPKMTALYTAYEYDEKDRQIKTILPDGSIQFAEFEIKDGKSVSYSIDPLGNVSVQETDSRGNIVRVAKNDKDGKQLTEVTYRYNEMGEMLNAYDAKGHPITAEYDLLGRRTALESLDSGRQEFFYDECSNLVRENNSVLRENNKQIVYEYDGLNRLVRIDYPDTEDTVYTYGDINDAHGAAGKILSVTDASGTLEYEYGKLGETTKETRTLSTHLNGNNPTETAVMEYRSDYLGRMQWITYPDGEKITYGYDKGGQVTSVTGEHYGHSFEYVTNILYDQYGQRTRIDYGNGTFTEYNYDPARRWLDKIKTQNKWGQGYQNISYSFDAVGNVLGYENDCLDSVTGNYKTKQSYSYDNLYQLIKVDGETTYNPYKSSSPEFVSNYSQLFEFDTDGLGNMTSKVSSETVTPHKTIGDNLNYSFNYVYNENYAHRLVRAGDRYYKYDANGNIVCEQDGSFESNGDDVSYHKITKETENVYSTDYGWGLFSEENGSGGGVKGSRYCRTYAWNEKNQLISSVDSNYNTAYVYGQDGQRSNKYTANSETLYFNKMWTLHTDSGNNIYGGQTAKNIYLGETRIVTKLNSGTNPTYQEEYYKQYYYHSDHLGSASLISDYKGDEYQRIEYTPYGETWVDKTSNTGLEWLPYKFTAKELDEETGLYYYGARYLDPKYSMWISTDPALGEYIPKAPIDEEAKKYNQNLPGMGGVFNHINGNLYHYVGNNPVRYIDPDGRSLLGNLCYVGAALVLAAGTTVSVISGGTLAVFVEPAAVKASLALAATGVAINTSELITNNVESKQISIPQVQAKEKEQKTPTTIYRTGSGNGTNLTPRTPKDSTGLSYSLTKPLSGPYTVTTMEAVNATGVLSAVKDGPNHVSVVPNDMSKMPEWQASREHANETPHVYTKILQTISVKVKE